MDETTINTGTPATFTEAPATASVRFILNDFDCALTLRDMTGAAVLTRLTGAIQYLTKIGAVPAPVKQPAPAAPGNSNGNGNGSTEPPTCPIHQKTMLRSKHGGWYCPVRILDDDGSGKPVYCKAKA